MAPPGSSGRVDVARCQSCFTELSDLTSGVCEDCQGWLEEAIQVGDLPVGADVSGGRYVIGHVLGRGTFGLTYLAWDPLLRRRVAIKEFLPSDIAGRAADGRTVQPHRQTHHGVMTYARDRFRQEARVVSSIEHPNVIRIFDFFPDNGTEYMVMEYHAGQTLATYMDANGLIPESAGIGLMLIVLDALEEIHRPREGQSHIHRDLKPSNIYLAEVGASTVPKLLDFGAARAAVGERTQNLTQVLTPGYAPFEQYHSKGRQGPWTDVYAAAATLYHMLTGVRPTPAGDRMQGEPTPSPVELSADISASVSTAIMTGMAMKRDDRPASANAFARLLEDALQVAAR